MRKYDEEFKAEAVRKIFDGQSVASVARELGVGDSGRLAQQTSRRALVLQV